MKQVLAIIGLTIFLSVGFSHSEDSTNEAMELILRGARNSLPSIHVVSIDAQKRPNPAHLEEQHKTIYDRLSSKSDSLLAGIFVQRENLDRWIGHKGEYRTETVWTSAWIDRDRVRVQILADPGEVRVQQLDQWLIFDGKRMLCFDRTHKQCTLFDPNHEASLNLSAFDHAAYSPAIFGYKPGELLKQGSRILSLSEEKDGCVEIVMERKGNVVGRFIIDLEKGGIARESHYLVPSGQRVDILCNDIVYYSGLGIFYPQSAEVRAGAFLDEDFRSVMYDDNSSFGVRSQIQFVSIESLSAEEQGIFQLEIPKNTYVIDGRETIVENAKRGKIPEGFTMDFDSSVIVGIASENYDYQ